MSKETVRYSLKIEYRLSCRKEDVRNVCSDKNRVGGFYWREASGEEIQNQLKAIDFVNILNTDSITKIQKCIEKIEIPDDCEAVSAKLRILLSGSDGSNGKFRRNVQFEYFNTVM